MKFNKSTAKQGGFSMIELMITLAVITILTAAALYWFTVQRANARAENGKQEILTIDAQAKNLRPNGPYNFDQDDLIAANKIPEAMQTAPGAATGNTIKNQWGGTITFGQVTGNPALFEISSSAIPSSECNTIVGQLEPLYSIIEVGSTTVKDASTTPTVGSIATACASAANTITVTGS